MPTDTARFECPFMDTRYCILSRLGTYLGIYSTPEDALLDQKRRARHTATTTEADYLSMAQSNDMVDREFQGCQIIKWSDQIGIDLALVRGLLVLCNPLTVHTINPCGISLSLAGLFKVLSPQFKGPIRIFDPVSPTLVAYPRKDSAMDKPETWSDRRDVPSDQIRNIL